MIKWPFVLISLAMLLALACLKYQQRVPMVLRPDTRRIGYINIDSTVLGPIMQHFRTEFPNEGAVCLYGRVETVEKYLAITVTHFTPAVIDSADEFNVWFPFASGCIDNKELLAVAHTHTHVNYACTHSFPDANVLFVDKRLLFTLVFCGDGFTEALYQDGRRVLTRWAP